MGNSNQKVIYKWPLQKNKLSKVSSTKFGRPTMSIRAESSTRKRPRNSFRTPLATSDPVMSSPMKLSMRSSLPSTKTDLAPSRNQRWSSSSSSFLVATEIPEHQGGYNED